MTNFDNFLEKAREITANGIVEGKDCGSIENDAANYFGMSLSDYRKTMSAAAEAHRAQQVFTIRYYRGTHPQATVSSVALALDLPVSLVKTVTDTK